MDAHDFPPIPLHAGADLDALRDLFDGACAANLEKAALTMTDARLGSVSARRTLHPPVPPPSHFRYG